MEKDINDIINESNNIGSLCLYIQKRENLINIINNYLIDNNLYLNLTIAEKIFIFKNKYTDIYCECGKLKNWKSFKYGWSKTCGDKNCIRKSTINTNIEKYGVDNPTKNENIKNKIKNENIKKYGFSSAAKNEKIKEKISKKLKNRTEKQKQETKLKRNNTCSNKTDEKKNEIKNKIKNSNKNKTDEEKNEIKIKRQKTCLRKYNSEYAITSDKVRSKILKTFNEKFNGNTPFSCEKIYKKARISYSNNHVKYIKNNISKFKCDYISHTKINDNITYELLCLRTNKTFNISYSNLRIRILLNIEISPHYRKNHGKSEMESDILKFIKSNHNKEILNNKKNIISPLELDIYIPDLKLAFEFNGLYWHSEVNKENNYHLNKTEECEKQAIQLIHIYEDDWIYKQDIVKSIILNKLGKSEKIYARKTEIKEIDDNKLIRDFLEKNHIQGFIGSKIKIGLFYNNELVSLMTFGNRRVAMGKKSTNEGEYELLRFCNKLNTNIVGGASKLFKYFINKYNPNEITTYADRSFSQGNLYKQLGFEFIGKTEPNYYYIIDGIKHHRFNFRKDKLIKEGYDKNKTEHEIMLERKIYRIYDSGNLKFIYNKK